MHFNGTKYIHQYTAASISDSVTLGILFANKSGINSVERGGCCIFLYRIHSNLFAELIRTHFVSLNLSHCMSKCGHEGIFSLFRVLSSIPCTENYLTRTISRMRTKKKLNELLSLYSSPGTHLNVQLHSWETHEIIDIFSI